MTDGPPTLIDLKAMRAVAPRKLRGRQPIETDRTPVPVRGEKLHPVLWRGRQWAVTRYGIEALDGAYSIEANRLTEGIEGDHDGESYGAWCVHMAGKSWVDCDDFATAWLVACMLHGVAVKIGAVRAVLAKMRMPGGDDHE